MRKKIVIENPKAVAARERKKAVQDEKEAKKEQEIEDAKWIEDDKQILKKQQKKEADERKKLEQLKRKAEAKALLEMEMASIETTIKPASSARITRSQIQAGKEEQPKKKKEKDEPLFENINRVKIEHKDARTVDEAIRVLNGTSDDIDKHPERRMKAAYTAYEERRLQELKLINPTLRVSQLKQIIYKEWQKSPENPYNKIQSTHKPFTIFAPKNSPFNRAESLLQQPELVKKLLLDHVILGMKINLTNMVSATFPTLSGRNVTMKLEKGGNFTANNITVLEKNVEVPNGILIIVDSYLFPDEDPLTRNVTGSKRDKPLMFSSTHAPPEQSEKLQQDQPNVGQVLPYTAPKKDQPTTFVDNVMEVLSYLKSGVRVFQHFLARSNVSRLLKEGEEYTVFVPTDHAFQRWHPIDWGFYPFSVPEFTEGVIVNHFVKGRLKQENIKDGQVVQTVGGKDVTFKWTRSGYLSANALPLVKGDTPVEKGNIMFIGEVLFVTEAVVSKLHQQHRDKETPPLLAFPWFGAQFLSHAFLALERDKRFTHITRFLNLADLAPHISGVDYTFFVPTDSAFKSLGLDKMPDNYLSNGHGLEILLNHFVKGRLYDRDFKTGMVLTTLGNQTLLVNRTTESNIYIDQALIVEKEVFVYNLGTMYYINSVLHHNTMRLPPVPIAGNPNTTPTSTASTDLKNSNRTTTTELPVEQVSGRDVEKVTEELSTEKDPEVLFGDATHKSTEDEEIEYTTLASTVSSVAQTTQKQNISLTK